MRNFEHDKCDLISCWLKMKTRVNGFFWSKNATKAIDMSNFKKWGVVNVSQTEVSSKYIEEY